MLTLGEILKPRHVALGLQGADAVSALDPLAGLLQQDARVLNWAGFHGGLRRGAAEGLTFLSCGAALCHARTDAVSGMTMAAGRFDAPVSHGGADPRLVRFLFAIGLPPTMASEYLRVVGALARALQDESTVHALASAASEEEFVSILTQHELTL